MSQKPTKKPFAPPSAAARAPASSPMNLGMLEQLVKLMSENDLNTVDLREGTNRVILKRGAVYAAAASAPPAATAAPSSMSAPGPAASSAGASPAAVDPDAGLVPIKSPMVGTFYATPGPDQKAFVQVGSAINEESDVCIVEAMKVMNHIKAETRGTIAKIVAQSGKPVEFGTVLFLVKP